MNGMELATAFETYSDHVLDLERRLHEVSVIATDLSARLQIGAELPSAEATLGALDVLLGVSESVSEPGLKAEARCEIQSRLKSLRDSGIRGGGCFASSGHQLVEVVYRRRAEMYAVRVRPEYRDAVLGVTSDEDRNEALHKCGDVPEKVDWLRAQFEREDREKERVLDLAEGPTMRDLLNAVLEAERAVRLRPRYPRPYKRPAGNAKPSESSKEKQQEYTTWLNEGGLRYHNQLDPLNEQPNDDVDPDVAKARRRFSSLQALEPLLQELQEPTARLDVTVGEADDDDVHRLWAGLDDAIDRKSVVEVVSKRSQDRGLRELLLDERRLLLGAGPSLAQSPESQDFSFTEDHLALLAELAVRNRLVRASELDGLSGMPPLDRMRDLLKSMEGVFVHRPRGPRSGWGILPAGRDALALRDRCPGQQTC